MPQFPQEVRTFVTKTAAYTAQPGDTVLADTTTTAAFTVTLPPVAVTSGPVGVRNITGTNAVTVKTADGSTIDRVTGTTGIGYTTIHTGATFESDGTSWWVTGA